MKEVGKLSGVEVPTIRQRLTDHQSTLRNTTKRENLGGATIVINPHHLAKDCRQKQISQGNYQNRAARMVSQVRSMATHQDKST